MKKIRKRYRTKEEWDEIREGIKKAKEGKIIPEPKPEPKKKLNKALILLPVLAALIIALIYIFLMGGV